MCGRKRRIILHQAHCNTRGWASLRTVHQTGQSFKYRTFFIPEMNPLWKWQLFGYENGIL